MLSFKSRKCIGKCCINWFGAAPILVNACKKIGIKRVIFISTTAIFTKLNSKSKSLGIR